MPWGDAHGYTPLSSSAILPAFIWQKSTSLLCLAWTLSSSAFRNFSHLHKCTPIKTVRCSNPYPVLTTTPSKPLSLYKCWNIHMHTYFPFTFLTAFFFFEENIFLHFKLCHIYEGRRSPHGKHSDASPGPTLVRGQTSDQMNTGAILQHSFWERRSWKEEVEQSSLHHYGNQQKKRF